MGGQAAVSGPDLVKEGVLLSNLPEGEMSLAQAFGEGVLLVRRGEVVKAMGSTCTHYGGPLIDGLLVGDEVRCPWHHACFRLDSGVPRAPALNPVSCFEVERRDGRVFVTKKSDPVRPGASSRKPASVVILGGGAAGNSAAESLRAKGYQGPVTMISRDDSVPYDRPNVSKDYLAGTAPEEWIPLRSRAFYEEKKIDLLLGAGVASLDTKTREVSLEDGRRVPFESLILALGATPVRLPVPGMDLPHVHTLRTLADSRAIIAAVTKGAKRAVVIGASFIGLEVAASLRARDLEVDVVAREALPLEIVLGREAGEFVRDLHASKGVRFHLGEEPKSFTAREVTLGSGKSLPCDLVVVGVGVRPATRLAEKAGLLVEDGVVTDEFLQTSQPGIYAAGDLARYLDVRTKRRQRVEHWVHAQRQGEVAAANVLGAARAFSDPPFFWSQHYDVGILYVGHATKGGTIEVKGSLAERSASIVFRSDGVVTAVATIGRDLTSLRAEAALARGDAPGLEAILKV
jgi:NADPH-dependent 2,4-dienoyl-CoA reductase/sulfur reductase-like enzyme/nitrite reductase/ring-hydroxylating ferredoxin subunit